MHPQSCGEPPPPVNEEIKFEDIDLEQLIINKNSDKINEYQDIWAKKLMEADKRLQSIAEELSQLEKDLIDKKGTKRKGHHLLRNIRKEAEIIDRAYWRAK